MENIYETGFGTLAVHAGHRKDPRYAHLVPIYASSTYVFDNAEQGMKRFSGEEEGYIYSRWGNPTMTEAEEKISILEAAGWKEKNGNDPQLKAILHGSGMAAISTLMLSLLKAGEKVLTHFSLYGGTEELLQRVLPGLQIEAVIADLRDPEIAEELISKDPSIKMLYLETPANPTLQCVDIEELTQIAHNHQVLVACDNTFATPYLQQPFRFGADYVVHSTTKFLNGHGTAIGGVLLGRDIERMNSSITKTHRLLGGNANPFDAFLLINGIKTLELRMDRHCENAMHVAHFLEKQTKVEKVNYTGLTNHPDYDIAQKQMRHPGAMLSFELKGGLQAGIKCMDNLKLCTRTVSLGTCDTLLSHPASMTHKGVEEEKKKQYGITDGLIRMSVGIENFHDIMQDLEQAINAS